MAVSSSHSCTYISHYTGAFLCKPLGSTLSRFNLFISKQLSRNICHALLNFKKLYLCCYLPFHISYPSLERAKIKFSEKKKNSVSGNHNIPQKKLTRHISTKKNFSKFIKNVIWPGNSTTLCNMAKTVFNI